MNDNNLLQSIIEIQDTIILIKFYKFLWKKVRDKNDRKREEKSNVHLYEIILLSLNVNLFLRPHTLCYTLHGVFIKFSSTFTQG